MITLFGATGFTGRLIAAALDQENLPFRLAGRSQEKLAELSGSLPSRPAWIIADVTRPATLPPLLLNTRVLINCAGPFTDLGERVVTQAAMSGFRYLDINNELGFTYRAQGYHEMARRTGATLVPSCGFEVALADCAAAALSEKLHISDRSPAEEFNVVYDLGRLRGSRGTRRSAVRSLATSWLGYHDSGWAGVAPGINTRLFNLPSGNHNAVSFPSCESITIPSHSATRRVDTWMVTSRAMKFWGPFLVPLFARTARSILRDPILWLAAQGGWHEEDASKNATRSAAPFTITVSARRGRLAGWYSLSGVDPYGLTARIATYAAGKLLSTDNLKQGVLPPARALDPADFLRTAQEEWGVSIKTGLLTEG